MTFITQIGWKTQKFKFSKVLTPKIFLINPPKLNYQSLNLLHGLIRSKLFLVVTKRLYKRVYPSVGPSVPPPVGNAFAFWPSRSDLWREYGLVWCKFCGFIKSANLLNQFRVCSTYYVPMHTNFHALLSIRSFVPYFVLNWLDCLTTWQLFTSTNKCYYYHPHTFSAVDRYSVRFAPPYEDANQQ